MQSEKNKILTEIQQLLTGPLSPVPGVSVSRHDKDVHSHHCLSTPILGFIAQGHKYVQTGGYEISLTPGKILATCVDMPNTSSIIGATPAKPFLGLVITLDRHIITDLLPNLPVPMENPQGDCPASVCLQEASSEILDAFLRLARLMHQPDFIPALGPLLVREIHFRILVSPIGAILSHLYRHGGRDNPIMDVMLWLKNHLDHTVAIEDLARRANMSVSSFHRHFKTITGITPLQYHKSLRLYEAQRLMLTEEKRVSEASAAVGYESVAQFNREYRRMFGAPPRRDIQRRMRKLAEI